MMAALRLGHRGKGARAAAFLIAAGSSACIHSGGDRTLPLADAGVEDPDPEAEASGPEFCNPTGRRGDDLRHCYEFNDKIYSEFDEAAKKREPWFNFTHGSWADTAAVDTKYVMPVVKEAEAIERLEATPLVALTSEEALVFTGKNVEYPGLKPYLVRALLYFKETGNFAVFERDQAILVRHDSVGGAPPEEKRTALVVFLPYKPKEVYVDCQWVE